MNNKIYLKRDILAVFFGMFIVLVTFGDAAQLNWIGNLDSIFGPRIWWLMDVIYPSASIVIFLLYGALNNSLKVNLRHWLPFAIFLFALALMQFDDFFVLFGKIVTLPPLYWNVIRCVYIPASIITFLWFGRFPSRD